MFTDILFPRTDRIYAWVTLSKYLKLNIDPGLKLEIRRVIYSINGFLAEYFTVRKVGSKWVVEIWKEEEDQLPMITFAKISYKEACLIAFNPATQDKQANQFVKVLTLAKQEAASLEKPITLYATFFTDEHGNLSYTKNVSL